MLELLEGLGKTALIVVCLYFILKTYARREMPAWSEPWAKRRFSIIAVLILAVSALALGEDVVGRETNPVDTAILFFIHDHVPRALTGFFEVATLTGSSSVLVPLTAVTTIGLLGTKHRYEAWLVAWSVITGAIVVFVVKFLVGRDRPELWDTEWYWGSSFPSGHTLVVAAFATAAALCVTRFWPRLSTLSLCVAFAWIALVAISRLVLGVHWPTDVLVAACIGAFLPLAMSVGLELRSA